MVKYIDINNVTMPPSNKPTNSFQNLPTEIKLRITEHVDAFTLIALLRTSHNIKDLIDRHRQSIIKGIIEQQYSEALAIITWTSRRRDTFVDKDSSGKWQILSSCEDFLLAVRIMDSTSDRTSDSAGLDTKAGDPVRDWITWLRKTPWGTLNFVAKIDASIDRQVSRLAQESIIIRDPRFDMNGLWVFFERDKSAYDTSTHHSRLLGLPKYSTPDLKRALYLFWKLQWLLLSSQLTDGTRLISDQERTEFFNSSSPQTRRILRLLIEEMAFELSHRPAVRVVTKHYDPSRSDIDYVSAAITSRLEREDRVIRREQEYIVVSDIIFQGPRIMDLYGDNPNDVIPGGLLGRERCITRWLVKDSQLTTEESQAAWEERDLVHLGFLSKEPETRLMIGKKEWEATCEEVW